MSITGGICFCALILTYKVWKFFYHYFIGHALGHTPDLRSFGKWCVVTGCTSGIGKSYAHAFAKLGLNVVLISRDLQKLKDLEKDLVEKYGVEIKVIVADFANPSDEVYEKIKVGLKGIDIGILVNNAGALHKVDKFCDLPNVESETKRIININMTSHTRVTAMVLPEMVKKNKGLIIFISSIGAFLPTQYLQLYGATKSYIDYFARALNEEYESESLIIQSVLPGPVCTNMLRSEPSFLAVTPDDYVKSQLRTIGIASRTCGYYKHDLLVTLNTGFTNLFPPKIMRKRVQRHMEKMKSTVFGYQLVQ